MLSLNDKISVRQLQILLILDIFGTGVIILPRRVAEFVNQDGWIVIILTTILAMGFAFIVTSIGRMFPKDTFLTYCAKIVSKPIAIALSLGLVIKIIVNISMELRFFGEILRQTMLSKTPFGVICTGMILVSAYAAAKGIEAQARMAEILIFLVFVPLTFVFLIAALDVDFSNLLPVMVAKPNDLLRGSFFTGVAFNGLEFGLLVFPYMQRPKHVRKGLIHAVSLIGAFMLMITVITIAKFGPFDVKRQIWPVLEMMDVIDFPGAFIERQDALIMSFWIISVFSIVAAGLFFSSVLLKDVFKKATHSTYILICIPIVVGISYMPKNVTAVYSIMDFMYITFGIAYLLVIPVLLLVIAKLRGLGKTDAK